MSDERGEDVMVCADDGQLTFADDEAGDLDVVVLEPTSEVEATATCVVEPGERPSAWDVLSDALERIVLLQRFEDHVVVADAPGQREGMTRTVGLAPDVAPAARTPCCYAFVYRGVT